MSRYAYTKRNTDGVRHNQNHASYVPTALGDGTAQTVTNGGGTLTYVFNNMFFDNDDFTTAFDVKRAGVYRADAYVTLDWAVVPTSGTVLVQIKDAGGTVVCGWRQEILDDLVYFTIGGLHTIDRDSLFEVFIQNNTNQDLDVTVKMGVQGVIFAQ